MKIVKKIVLAEKKRLASINSSGEGSNKNAAGLHGGGGGSVVFEDKEQIEKECTQALPTHSFSM